MNRFIHKWKSSINYHSDFAILFSNANDTTHSEQKIYAKSSRGYDARYDENDVRYEFMNEFYDVINGILIKFSCMTLSFNFMSI